VVSAGSSYQRSSTLYRSAWQAAFRSRIARDRLGAPLATTKPAWPPSAPPPAPLRPRPNPPAHGRVAVNGRVISSHQAGRGQPRAKPRRTFRVPRQETGPFAPPTQEPHQEKGIANLRRTPWILTHLGEAEFHARSKAKTENVLRWEGAPDFDATLLSIFTAGEDLPPRPPAASDNLRDFPVYAQQGFGCVLDTRLSTKGPLGSPSPLGSSRRRNVEYRRGFPHLQQSPMSARKSHGPMKSPGTPPSSSRLPTRPCYDAGLLVLADCQNPFENRAFAPVRPHEIQVTDFGEFG
jgi:hypothetical protein